VILEAIEALGVWSWWIIGLVLLAVELAAPGSFMLWFGVSALAVGVISLVLPWPWQAQIVVFAVLSLVSVVLSRRYLVRGAWSEEPMLNQRVRRLLGRTCTLREPIVSGFGRLEIDDTVWRVSGPNVPAGETVRVVGAEGPVLMVEPAGADDLRVSGREERAAPRA
jgi:membrane protein implicated in regulation of membrane protease activity